MKFKNKQIGEKNISLGKLVHILCKHDKLVDREGLLYQLQFSTMTIKDGGRIDMPFRKFLATIIVHF